MFTCININNKYVYILHHITHYTATHLGNAGQEKAYDGRHGAKRIVTNVQLLQFCNLMRSGRVNRHNIDNHGREGGGGGEDIYGDRN